MTKFKILISPAKSFNEKLVPSNKIINTQFKNKTDELVRQIKSTDISDIFRISDKLMNKVKSYYTVFGKETYKAIDLYSGLVFKQLDIDEKDIEWVNEHILIIDALYGLIRPNDYISKYRLDFYSNLYLDLDEYWRESINDNLKDYDLYSLASKEFESLIVLPFTRIETDKDIKQIKVARGGKLNQLIKEKLV